eukprot:15339818-Ditylum_brightwellii.AAC.1
MYMLPYFLYDENGTIITTDCNCDPQEVHIIINIDLCLQACPQNYLHNDKIVLYNPDALLEPEIVLSTFISDRNHLGFKLGFIHELGVDISWDLYAN